MILAKCFTIVMESVILIPIMNKLKKTSHTATMPRQAIDGSLEKGSAIVECYPPKPHNSRMGCFGENVSNATIRAHILTKPDPIFLHQHLHHGPIQLNKITLLVLPQIPI